MPVSYENRAQNILPEQGKVVVSTKNGDECGEVVVGKIGRGSLVAYEHSEGSLTEHVFDARTREIRVIASAYDLAFALGPCPKEPLTYLAPFFQAGARDLADLMDHLDAAMANYRYDVVFDREISASRNQSFRPAS